MSGHSKWSTIKRHKAAIDAKKGKIFSVISKELTIAARAGGSDEDANPRLRTVIQKARAANMPRENVDRAIKKGTGELPGAVYETLLYEAYGPGGVGIIVEVATDNKNRSASMVRSTFTKAGYDLAKPGSLTHSFSKLGQFFIAADKTTEDALMEIVLDAGADDIKVESDHFEVLCPLSEFDSVSAALTQADIEVESSELAWISETLVPVADKATAEKLLRLIENLEDLEGRSFGFPQL